MRKFVYLLITLGMIANLSACDANGSLSDKAEQENMRESDLRTSAETPSPSLTSSESEKIVAEISLDSSSNMVEDTVKETSEPSTDNAQSDEKEETEALVKNLSEDNSKPVYTASISFVNNTGVDIKELYLALSADESWGPNVLANGYVFSTGDQTEAENISVTYTPDLLFSIKIVTSDDAVFSFDMFTFGGIDDPNNATITFTVKDGDFCLQIT